MEQEKINKEIFERLEQLESIVLDNSVGKKLKKVIDIEDAENIDFSLNERAFVKRYAADKSGPKKFTFLLAYLTKGKIEHNISLNEIKKHWNKMTSKSLLGKFNMFYPNDAKVRGWINSTEHGIYFLTKEWVGIFK